jgi:hypothetical protein
MVVTGMADQWFGARARTVARRILRRSTQVEPRGLVPLMPGGIGANLRCPADRACQLGNAPFLDQFSAQVPADHGRGNRLEFRPGKGGRQQLVHP